MMCSPAARSVVPVSTTSQTASATPSRQAVSTAPSSLTTPALIPCSSRKRCSSTGYAVAIRLPASCSTSSMPDSIGEANRNDERPKPSGMTSTAALSSPVDGAVSSSMSRPVMPTSSVPAAT